MGVVDADLALFESADQKLRLAYLKKRFWVMFQDESYSRTLGFSLSKTVVCVLTL